MIQVRINTEQLKADLQKHARAAVDKAVVRAMNRTLNSLRTKTKKELATTLGVQQKAVAKRIFVVKATARSPRARLRVGDVGLLLALFSPRQVPVQTKRGPRRAVQVTVNGNTFIVPGGFLAKDVYGKKMVFGRRGEKRYPIKPLRTDSLSKLFDSAGFLRSLEDFTQATFEKNFNADLAYFLNRDG